MIFNCEMKNNDNKVEKWTGKIRKLIDYEVFIESRSSLTILFGTSSSGGFASIPDFQVGCYLINLKDKFWNTEKLTAVLGKVDGITAATALYQLHQKCII